MTYCDFCNQETGFLPFKCNYCGGKFCNTHRLPENHACNFDIEHKIQVQSEKQHRWLVTRRLKQKRIVSTRRIVGVYYLYLLIFIPSIIAFLYPHYLSISYRTFYYYPFPFMWTLISSIFIISFVNIFELIYFLTLLFFAYYFLKVIEASHGPKFLLSLFLLFAILTGGFNLFMSMFVYHYYFVIYVYYIGLASGALLGLITFTLLINPTQEWIFLKYGIKGTHVLGFLIILNIISKIITTGINFTYLDAYYYGYSVVWYIFDFFGILASIIYSEAYYKKRKNF